MPAPETLRELRRGQIVAVARRIVAEEGLEALTIGSLEARLQFSRGVITYHFQNKDDIVHAVLESAIEDINAATAAQIAPGMSSEERLRIALATYIRGFVDKVEAARILVSFWGRVTSDRRARKANADLYAGYRKGVAQLLENARTSGEFVTDFDADGLAAVLVGLVIGVAVQSYFEKGAIDVEAATREAIEVALARLAKRSS